MVKELLDIVTSHALGEEAVGAIFYRPKGKAKWDEDAGKGASNHPNKKKNKQRREGSLVATADRRGTTFALRCGHHASGQRRPGGRARRRGTRPQSVVSHVLY